MSIEWTWGEFDTLSGRQVHDILQLRMAVFAVEQNCIYQDVDGGDPKAWHLCGWADGLVLYLRAFAPGVEADEAVIGRVIVRADQRGAGLGYTLMNRGLERVVASFGAGPVRVSAQAHLERFYSALGFARVGPDYLEDGIPHLPMVRAQ